MSDTEGNLAGDAADLQDDELFLLKSWMLEGEYVAMKEYLEGNKVKQDTLDSCLLEALQILQMKHHGISYITESVKILLVFGAKWEKKKVLEKLMTPYHIACYAPDDQNEILDLLIKSSDKISLNNRDARGCSALMYAVQHGNIKCLKSLIANGADPNVGVNKRFSDMLNPLITSIKRLHPTSPFSVSASHEILDLLLENSSDINKCCSFKRTPLMYAASVGSIECVRKLINRGAWLDATDCEGKAVWAYAALSGSVEILRCLFEHGIDKDSSDKQGRSVLFWAVKSRNVESMRYLLNEGVSMGTYIPGQSDKSSKWGTVNRLYLDSDMLPFQQAVDPCMLAIDMNMPHVVRLMEEYGCQKFKTFDAIRKAVTSSSVEVLDYLLVKHKYPLNHDYTVQYPFGNTPYQTLLAESCYVPIAQVPKLLLEYGADPNKKNCDEKGCTPIHIATVYGCPNVEMIAHIIRNGANVDLISYDQAYGNILPFEGAVLHQNIHAAEMVLTAGGNTGVYSLSGSHRFEDYPISTEFEALMKVWNIRENNPKSLQQFCRKTLLYHLSPAADKKLTKLPLPKNVIMYLHIPELDDIIDESIVQSSQIIESSMSEQSDMSSSSSDELDSDISSNA